MIGDIVAEKGEEPHQISSLTIMPLGKADDKWLNCI